MATPYLSSPTRRRIPPWGVVLIVLGSLCGLSMIACGFFGYRVLDIGAARDLPEIAAKYRAADFPWVAADLARKPPLRNDQNAAPVLKVEYAAIGSSLPSKFVTNVETDLDKRNYKAAAKLLEPYRSAMSGAIGASRLQGADWNRDFDLGPTLLFPEMVQTKGMVKALCYGAEVDAGLGRDSDCLTKLTAARRLGQFAKSDGFLIGMLVHIACDAIIDKEVQRCAALVAPQQTVFEKLAGLDFSSATGRDFIAALRAEAYMGVATSRNLDQYDIQSLLDPMDPNRKPFKLDPLKLRRDGYPDALLHRAVMATMMQSWTKMGPVMQQYPDDPRRVGQAMDDIAVSQENAGISIGKILSSIMFPVFKQAGEAVAKDQADTECTHALMVALAYKARTGHYPASITDLGTKWIDPYTNSPLKLKVKGESIRIYSLGPTTNDFGGITQTEANTQAKNAKHYNIAAIYPPLPRHTGKKVSS